MSDTPKGPFIEEYADFCRCGKKLHIGKQDGEYVILHAMEPCAEYLRLDPTSYVRWLRGAKDN